MSPILKYVRAVTTHKLPWFNAEVHWGLVRAHVRTTSKYARSRMNFRFHRCFPVHLLASFSVCVIVVVWSKTQNRRDVKFTC